MDRPRRHGLRPRRSFLEVDQKDLVVALKTAEEELNDKVLGNMSERVRTFITEEMEFLGPMRVSEVGEIQLRIVQQVRQLEEQGQSRSFVAIQMTSLSKPT